MQSNYSFGLPNAGPTLMTTAPLKVGTVVAGRFQVEEAPLVGKRKVAYKSKMTKPHMREIMLLQPIAQDVETVRLFEAEQQALRAISHPGIVVLVEHGQCKKHGRFTALEYVSGPTLALAMREERRLETERALTVFAQVCMALHAVHKQGLVHGAIKANHVVLNRPLAGAEAAKLIDFSLSQPFGEQRLLRSADWVETFQSVGQPSPEELSGESLDARSDIYSVGCLLYKILTGRAPFTGSSAEEIREKHLNEPVPPLHVAFAGRSFSTHLESCIMRTLAKKQAQRYQTAEELAKDLNQCLRNIK